jgi:hypothetical protein
LQLYINGKSKPMKKKTPTKKAPVKKVEAKKVAPSKPAAPAKKPAATSMAEVAKLNKELEAYKVTVGQLEATVDALRQKNAKLKKRLDATKAKPIVEPAPVKTAVATPGITVDTAPKSPFMTALPSAVPTVNSKFAKCSTVKTGVSDFLKKASATKY